MKVSLATLACTVVCAFSWSPVAMHHRQRAMTSWRLHASYDDIDDMKAGEMKAELDMRGVSWAGCYDKTDLKELLRESRARGVSDPSVVDQFNTQMAEVSNA